jgi:hypothetical protein
MEHRATSHERILYDIQQLESSPLLTPHFSEIHSDILRSMRWYPKVISSVCIFTSKFCIHLSYPSSTLLPWFGRPYNSIVDFLNIIHRPDSYLKTTFRRLDSVSVLSAEIRTGSIDWVQRSRLFPVDGDRVQSPNCLRLICGDTDLLYRLGPTE